MTTVKINPAPAPAPDSWYAMVPKELRTDGPYGETVAKVHEAFKPIKDFIVLNYKWCAKTSGAKAWFIKFPEAAVKIYHRFSASPSIPPKMRTLFNSYVGPFVEVTKGAKPFLSLLDVRKGIDKIKASLQPEIVKYVVVDDQQNYQKVEFSRSLWEQRASIAEAVSSMITSVAETESYLSKRPILGTFSQIASPILSLSTIYTEGSFLYKTVWLRQMKGAEKLTPVEVDAAAKIKVAPQQVAGSLLKVALSVVCLSLDVFSQMGQRANPPSWLGRAQFWAVIAVTLMPALAYTYWPKLVVEPLTVQPKPA